MRLLLLLPVLALSGCRESYCQRLCDVARPQLIRDFAVPPEAVDCSAEKFAELDTCPQCEQLFEREYGVQFSTPCDAGETSYVEPVN